MIKAMRDWANKNYEKGGDIFVEAYDDKQLGEILNEAGGDVKVAISLMQEIIKCKADYMGEIGY